MLTILLIDDEDLELDGLEAMISGMGLECEICGRARNAAQGIDLAQRLRPDLILSDVKMPGMDGIEMVRRIREKGVKTFLAFLSGYQDFSAAQQAIELGARAYLLKPVNYESLRSVIAQAANENQENLREERRKSTVAGDLRRLGQLEQTMYLKKLMLSRSTSLSAKEIEDCREGLHTRGEKYAVCVLKIHLEDDTVRFLESDLPAGLEGAAVRHNAYPPVVLPGGTIGFLFHFPGFISEAVITGQLMKAGSEIVEIVSREAGRQSNLGVSGISRELEEVHQLVRQADQAVGQAFYGGRGNILLYEGEAVEMEGIRTNLPEHVQEVLSAITMGSETEYEVCLKNLFARWDRGTGKEKIHGTCIEIISTSRRICGLTAGEEKSGSEEECYTGLLEQDTFNRTYEYMLQYGQKLCRMMAQRKRRQGNQLVEQVETIIQSEFAQPISIDTLAERVRMSPSYVSRVFKNQTGETILDYLQSVRMQKALEFLEDPKYHIYEIGVMAGYENPSYFSMVFKKYYGVTPGKYRERLHIREEQEEV